nr:hypothetical protein [Tanacetum cinerariifolium]
MNPIATQQAALDNALVLSEKRLKIERCNARIAFSKPQREETYQVTLEALKLSLCYLAFQITAELEKKKFRVDTEVFHEILHICPRILNQDFISPHSEEELVTFIQELGYSGRCNMLSAIHTDQMHQPWRIFIAIINRINLHTIRNDSLLGTLKFVSKTEDSHKYGVLIPDDMINQDIKYSKAYKTYYDFVTGKVAPKKARKFKKIASPSRKMSHVKEAEPIKKAKRIKRPAKNYTTTQTAGVVIRDTLGVSISKKKAPAKADKSCNTPLRKEDVITSSCSEEPSKSKEALHKLRTSLIIRLNLTVQNWYGTPRESLRESGEAMSARRSERQPKGRCRFIRISRETVNEKERMAWQTDYCIMQEGMSILRGQKSVPGMNSSKREMERGHNIVGNKMHKAFPLPGESSHWQYKFPLPVEGIPTARRMEIPLPGVCTAMMKKLPVKENWQLH